VYAAWTPILERIFQPLAGLATLSSHDRSYQLYLLDLPATSAFVRVKVGGFKCEALVSPQMAMSM
jgi:hypothetical protein